MAKQRIDGSHNVQVGKVEGDLNLERRAPIMREDDPNIVECPYGCGQLTWYDAEECWNCSRRVKDYFIEQGRKALLETRNMQIVVVGALALAVLYGSQYLPAGWKGYAVALGLGGLGLTALLIKATEELKG